MLTVLLVALHCVTQAMDLSAYSESFKFWLQFFCQKSLGGSNLQEVPGNDLLANFWTLLQLQQYSALGVPAASAKDDLLQLPLPLPMPMPPSSNLIGHFPQRCRKSDCKQQQQQQVPMQAVDVATCITDTQSKHHRAKRTPKRLSSVCLSACNSRHSPACSSGSSPNHAPLATSSAQQQPIIKMDLSKEEIAEINCELSKIENRIGPYKCMLCLFTFDDAIQLACHSCPNIINVEYRCPECSKVFNCPANLASHRRWHKRRQSTGATVAVNGTLPSFAGSLASPTALPYDLFELPAKRVCLAADANASKQQCAPSSNQGKQPARFSVEFLLGCKLLEQDAFGKSSSTNRNAEIETS